MTEPQTIEKYIEPNWMIDVPLRRRGSKHSWPPGEFCFRMEAKALGTRYRSFRKNKEKKAELSRTLVKFVQDKGGGFLVEDEGGWYVVDDKVALRMASQVLRNYM